MKVKELIKLLSDFNPNADVVFNDCGIEHPIEFYGWQDNNGDDCYGVGLRDVENEKLEAVSISFTSADSNTMEEQ